MGDRLAYRSQTPVWLSHTLPSTFKTDTATGGKKKKMKSRTRDFVAVTETWLVGKITREAAFAAFTYLA